MRTSAFFFCLAFCLAGGDRAHVTALLGGMTWVCEDRKLGKWYDAGGYTVGRGHGVCVSRHTLQHRGVWLEARSTGQRGAGIKCALCDAVQALMHPVQRRRRGNSRHQGALCHAGGGWACLHNVLALVDGRDVDHLVRVRCPAGGRDACGFARFCRGVMRVCTSFDGVGT